MDMRRLTRAFLNECVSRLAAGDVKQWLEAKPDRPLSAEQPGTSVTE
jgi:hypothetical protein